ncbi:permease [Helicovermis profundi]|uniref:Permease n=1 Tax=Helicovermis profundi TaxID=3065157 RepID=A0AAU9E5B6_9FIRM|nr:hypothetical protein HLPR_19790 [Clostridia bacterium S502]
MEVKNPIKEKPNMKKQLKSTLIEALKYIGISGVIILIVYFISPQKAVQVNKVVEFTFSKAIKIMLGVFLIIGLLQVWLTPKQISKFIGKESGIKGMAIASIFPIILGGSLVTIFPLLKTLKEKGVPIRILITFIVAWAGKAPLLPLETEFLGVKFAALRIGIIIPLAIIIGLVSEKLIGEE